MATFVETTHVREVLIVRPTVDSPLACHQKKITILTKDGAAYSETYGEPEALNADDLAGVLNPLFVDLATERDQAVTDLSALQASYEDQGNQLSAALSQIEALEQRISALENV